MQLALFAFVRTIFNTAYRMIYPFLGVFARALGVDLAEMSMLMSIRSLGGALVPFIAPVADYRGRKFGMLLGLGLFILSMALVVIYPTFLTLGISMFFATLAKYIFDPAMQAYLGDRTSYDQRGRAIAITELGWSLAFVVGVPLVGFLISDFGWMAPFPLLALLALLSFILLIVMLPKDETPVGKAATAKLNFGRVFNSIPAMAGLSITLWATIGNELVNLIFGVWLEDSFGLKIAALGASAAVIGFSEVGGEGLVALLSDKLGKERAVGYGLVVNAAMALLLPVLAQNTVGALIGLFLFYITFEFTFVSTIPMMTEVMPTARATLMAFNVGAFSLGRGIGAPIATFLYGFGFPVVVVGTVIFNLFALLALRRLGQK